MLLCSRPGSFAKTVALGKQDKLILRQSLISIASHPTLAGPESGRWGEPGQHRLVRPWSKPWDYRQLTEDCPIPREKPTPSPGPGCGVPECGITCHPLEFLACFPALHYKACTTDQLAPSRPLPPHRSCLSLLQITGSRSESAQLGWFSPWGRCFLKATLVASLELWLSSLLPSLPSPTFTF